MTSTSNSAGHLRSIVERIEKLEQDRAQLHYDVGQVYAEAKATGFDPKIIRLLVRIRKQDPSARQEEQAILDLYMASIGMAPEGEEVA